MDALNDIKPSTGRHSPYTQLCCTVALHLSGRWLSGSPIILFGLSLRVNLWRILQNQFALKLPVIGSNTEQCYGFQNFKSGMVKRFRCRYILYIITVEGVPILDKKFSKVLVSGDS